MAAHELGAVITDMHKEDPQAKCSGFEQQFKVEYILESDLTLYDEYKYTVGFTALLCSFCKNCLRFHARQTSTLQ